MKRIVLLFCLLGLFFVGCAPVQQPESQSPATTESQDSAGQETDSEPLTPNPAQMPELPLQLRRNTVQGAWGSYYVIAPNGDLVGWGSNERGELPGTQTSVPFSQRQVYLHQVKEVYCGYSLYAALDEDGRLYTWNAELFCDEAQFVAGREELAVVMEHVQTAAIGLSHAAAILDDGSLWVWGNNQYGVLGNGTDDGKDYPPEKRMEHVQAVFCDTTDTFVITEQAELYAFGALAGPEPKKLADGIAEIQYGLGYLQVRTTGGQVQKLEVQNGEVQFVPVADGAAQLVNSGYIDAGGTLWYWDAQQQAVEAAQQVVDACQPEAGRMFYLTADGTLHSVEPETGKETLSADLQEILPD